MARVKNYEAQVYAGVLGKVIGVYMGRPFEGWGKPALEEKWGFVDRYVHEDQNVPLIVPDDDIAGTFTFIRALEDSGLYERTPDAFFGDTWLNYLIEPKTVLWWGGMGHSTEHTAYIRLKQGLKSPETGSIEQNGKVVAEQIGAQIFIDAFGMVAPGKPKLAAELARKAARVSHDGEAVHAAAVVAGMVSAAFVEKNMCKLLDIGVGLIPDDCLIARIHRDVRDWAKKDKDWRKTYDRIDKKYGYHKYGGNCHVVPNHAIMVMAWVYAPDDFHQSQAIINTAGWDTDCNAANVGSVMGIKVGLDRICEKYDFRSPFADRVIIPTAEGTRSMSDCLLEANCIARIGRKIMGYKAPSPVKRGALHHFEMPGALHGWMAEASDFETRGQVCLSNVEGQSTRGTRCMSVQFEGGPGSPTRISTPMLPPVNRKRGGYGVMGTPRLASGQRVTVRGVGAAGSTGARARLFARLFVPGDDIEPSILYSSSKKLAAGKPFAIQWEIPSTDGKPVLDLGIELTSSVKIEGSILVDSVSIKGTPKISWALETLTASNGREIAGWITDIDMCRGKFSDEKEDVVHYGKNMSRGVVVTGNRDWKDYAFQTRLSVHLADKSGIMIRYQGLQRYIALEKTADKLRLVERLYKDTVLAETRCRFKIDELHSLRLKAAGKKISAYLDGEKILEAEDKHLGSGGCGFFFENGNIGIRDASVSK
ncbi:MAG: ADP-ribosylglycohydrolase family protein [Kiritimatiellia bacterium]|jgi:ADP-ribosylglycohydrolase|nr:ADP-ribosylglycohydrolase family protein [Kiritimatiellia bacterium]